MIDLASPEVLAPLRQAIEGTKATAGGTAELDALEAQLRADEKELLPKAAAGDHVAGATITMNRFKLEAIPAERERILSEHPARLLELWHVTAKVVDDVCDSARSLVETQGDEIQAAVAPVLAKFLEPDARVDLKTYAGQTKLGRLAGQHMHTLNLICLDYPSPNLSSLSGRRENTKARDYAAETERVILRKAARILQAVEAFQAALR